MPPSAPPPLTSPDASAAPAAPGTTPDALSAAPPPSASAVPPSAPPPSNSTDASAAPAAPGTTPGALSVAPPPSASEVPPSAPAPSTSPGASAAPAAPGAMSAALPAAPPPSASAVPPSAPPPSTLLTTSTSSTTFDLQDSEVVALIRNRRIADGGRVSAAITATAASAAVERDTRNALAAAEERHTRNSSELQARTVEFIVSQAAEQAVVQASENRQLYSQLAVIRRDVVAARREAERESEDEDSLALTCPITLDASRDPARSCDGTEFERVAIAQHVLTDRSQHDGTASNPLTRQPFSSTNVAHAPDMLMRQQWRNEVTAQRTSAERETCTSCERTTGRGIAVCMNASCPAEMCWRCARWRLADFMAFCRRCGDGPSILPIRLTRSAVIFRTHTRNAAARNRDRSRPGEVFWPRPQQPLVCRSQRAVVEDAQCDDLSYSATTSDGDGDDNDDAVPPNAASPNDDAASQTSPSEVPAAEARVAPGTVVSAASPHEAGLRCAEAVQPTPTTGRSTDRRPTDQPAASPTASARRSWRNAILVLVRHVDVAAGVPIRRAEQSPKDV